MCPPHTLPSGSFPWPCFPTCAMGRGLDLITSKFPSNSEHLSLQAALTSDTHPSTQQFSRSSFLSELEFLSLQSPVPPTQKNAWPQPSRSSLSCTPKAPSLLGETEQNLLRKEGYSGLESEWNLAKARKTSAA